MTEKNEKKSSGAGKFFLGAALGAIAGAVASKFVSAKKDEECECNGDCTCGCGCQDEEEPIKEKAPKKESVKEDSAEEEPVSKKKPTKKNDDEVKAK